MKETENTKAVKIMIKAHSEKRRNLSSAVKSQEEKIACFRANVRRDKLAEAERFLASLKSALKNTEEYIHELDTFETVCDEYAELHEQICELCEKRRELAYGLIESEFQTAKRDGKIFVM